MAITPLFSHQYYIGGGVSSEVPGVYPIAIDGHPYLLDLKSNDFKLSSLPLLRTQADQATRPGEQSLNPDDLWRRVVESWHMGAGQDFQDREESSPYRFFRSEGIDPWEKWEFSLLPDTANKRASANTNLHMVVAGSRLYITDGTEVRYTADITAGSPTFTNVTGVPGTAPTSIASDGYSVFTSHAASGIYLTNRTIGTTASWITGTVNLVRYVKGRLMAAAGPAVYNVTTSTATAGPTALPATLLTHGNADFAWVDMCEGTNMIYIAGYSGDKSLIYKTAIKPDGTALDVPSVAGELPDGEIVRAIQGYLGFILIGSDLGVRFAAADSGGNLTIGPLVRTGPCRAFEAQDRFVWFGWEGFTSLTSSGIYSTLGRLDLSVFTAPLQPAYASDLNLSTGGGTIGAIATVFHGTPSQELRVFSINGTGFVVQTADKRASGVIETGHITYGMFDKKFGMYFDVRCDALAGAIEVSVSGDDTPYESIGSLSFASSNGTVLAVGQLDARRFRFKITLTRDAVTTTGPTITRGTFRAYPAPRRISAFTVPILLYEDLNMPGGVQRHIDIHAELTFLIGIVQDRHAVTYQHPLQSFLVLIEDYEFQPHHMTRDGKTWNGTMVLRLKTITE